MISFIQRTFRDMFSMRRYIYNNLRAYITYVLLRSLTLAKGKKALERNHAVKQIDGEVWYSFKSIFTKVILQNLVDSFTRPSYNTCPCLYLRFKSICIVHLDCRNVSKTTGGKTTGVKKILQNNTNNILV